MTPRFWLAAKRQLLSYLYFPFLTFIAPHSDAQCMSTKNQSVIRLISRRSAGLRKTQRGRLRWLSSLTTKVSELQLLREVVSRADRYRGRE